MENFPHSIEDLEVITGVKRRYIDRCYESMDWLERYRKRSPEANKYYYSNNAVAIFHRIHDLKRQGFDRREIKKRLGEMGMENEKVPAEKGREEAQSSPESMENNFPINSLTTDNPPKDKTTTTEVLLIQALETAHARTIKSLEELLNRTQRETTDLRDDNKTLRNENKELRETILHALPAGKKPDITQKPIIQQPEETVDNKTSANSRKGKWSIFNQE